ncbi:FecR family protein [Zunongwangia endophytica]|uniref:FecR family protein n=1 Tax=Zunongwangia endophytica TaxID=1808945 RepID=A0ABV8H868_9FLAO|nr:FecR family protein [Zunongwangia endophytica]MDN3595557.1 FecR family protein [Zunongwangia endophytica]
MNAEIESIIVKFFCKEATAQELDKLELWLRSSDNTKLFRELLRLNFAIDNSLKHFNDDKVHQLLREHIKSDQNAKKRKKRRKHSLYTLAAIAIIAVAGVFYLKFEKNNFDEKNVTPNIVETPTGTPGAILTLEDGAEVILKKGDAYQIKGIKSDGKQLIYNDNQDAKKIAYNYLTVPRGAQFELKLSDGTKVWLNSDSKLKYPESFIEGKSRSVYLLYGEAYFEVSPSDLHHGSLFEVHNEGRVIQVLGTQFNVKSYKEETKTYTTLVEGNILLKSRDKKYALKPNDQMIYSRGKGEFKKQQVNVYNEISWKDGVFSFEDKKLKDIIQVLARWYDVKFDLKNHQLGEEEFVGVLSKDQEIEEILESIKSSGIINSYQIKQKLIIIN